MSSCNLSLDDIKNIKGTNIDDITNSFSGGDSGMNKKISMGDIKNSALGQQLSSQIDLSGGKIGEAREKAAALKSKGTKILNKIKNKNPITQWIFKTFYYTAIILFIVLVNCNFIFLIKKMNPTLTSRWFPTQCGIYPFGTKSNPPCEVDDAGAFKNVKCKAPLLAGGGPESQELFNQDSDPISDPNTKSKSKSENTGGKTKIDSHAFSDFIYPKLASSPDFPYNRYWKQFPMNGLTIRKDISNWFISSLAEASIAVNKNLLGIFDGLKGVNNHILFLISIVIIMMIIPFNFINTGARLILNQMGGIFDTAYTKSTFLILCFLPLNTLAWDAYYTLYKQLLLACKLMFYPLLMGEWTGLKAIFDDYKYIIMYLIGSASIYALWKTDFPQEYAYTVKIVPTIFYVLLLLGISIKYFVAKK